MLLAMKCIINIRNVRVIFERFAKNIFVLHFIILVHFQSLSRLGDKGYSSPKVEMPGNKTNKHWASLGGVT